MARPHVRQFTFCVKRVKTENVHSYLPGHAEAMLERYLRNWEQWLLVGEGGRRSTDGGRGGRQCNVYIVMSFGF